MNKILDPTYDARLSDYDALRFADPGLFNQLEDTYWRLHAMDWGNDLDALDPNDESALAAFAAGMKAKRVCWLLDEWQARRDSGRIDTTLYAE